MENRDSQAVARAKRIGELKSRVENVCGITLWKEAVPIRWVIIRDPLGKFATQAVFSTRTEASPKRIVEWFIKRWQLEVTFEESRRHLGIETNRQWSEKAIKRTTPCLFGLFSLITMVAQELAKSGKQQIRSAVW